MPRRTKIVATLGPASASPDRLEQVLGAGVDVVRLNLSHGELEEHDAVHQAVRRLSRRLDRPVGVLVDLPGPKIRAGSFPLDGAEMHTGDTVRLVAGDGPSTGDVVVVDYAALTRDVAPGDRVLIGDGGITLRVTGVVPEYATARVESGGLARGRPGVHLSADGLQLYAPTERDLVLARRMADAGVDYIAQSFVRRAADVETLRAVVGDRVDIVVKIETAAALGDLPAIVDAADAVMVARGDLGLDCPLEDLPHLQKHIIRHCVEVGRPVVTATQMLESMISAPVPTRAEVTDVANAILDGTDAVMLSGETAIGRDPAGVVATMARIAERAESEASYRQWAGMLGRKQRMTWDRSMDQITGAVSHAAWQAAVEIDATAIICCTQSGRTAKAMARFRPASRLVAASPDPRTVDRLTLSWGVEAFPVEEYRTAEETIWSAVEGAARRGLLTSGDTAVVLAGASDRPSGAATDMLRVVRLR